MRLATETTEFTSRTAPFQPTSGVAAFGKAFLAVVLDEPTVLNVTG